jgi:uroporphyrin-III C-methyltransferase/precorrin-2 dehydrogenase/sirohydrochlorin ferrochelatase
LRRAAGSAKAGAMQTLPLFVTLTGQPVIVLGDGEAAAAKARLVAAAGGLVVADPEAPARLAFVALDDEAEALAAAAALRARGLLINVVDRPAASDFLMGAIIDRSPVQVAISTGGASASLARALRLRLEALLPASLGALASAIYQARAATSARHPSPAARRRLWDAALAEGAALDPLQPLADADAAVATAIAGSSAAVDAVHHIRLASADPGDLTLNQLALLSRCDWLVAGPDVPAAVVDRARRDATRLAHLPAPPPPGLGVVLG